MQETVGQPASASRVVNFPTLPNRESLTARQLADAYCAIYSGRDHAKLTRVEWW